MKIFIFEKSVQLEWQEAFRCLKMGQPSLAIIVNFGNSEDTRIQYYRRNTMKYLSPLTSFLFLIFTNYYLLTSCKSNQPKLFRTFHIDHSRIYERIYYSFIPSIIMKEENMSEAEQTSLNLLKAKFFIETTDNNKPTIPSSIPMSQLIRQYLNDDDFLILVNSGQPAFGNVDEEQRIEKLYSEWLTTNQENTNIDNFIMYWINHSPQIQIRFSLYDDSFNTYEHTTFHKTKVLQKKQVNQMQVKQLGINVRKRVQIVTQRSLIKINKQQPSSLNLLQRFFIFYAKKQISSNIETFNQYQQQSNALNLTKWMRYCRDVGLTKIKKKLNNKLIKQMFIKHEDQKKQLNFQTFQTAVENLLKLVYTNDQQKIKNEGYELVGIKNQQSFQRKFQQMGEIVPNYCLQFKKKRINDKIGSKTSLKCKLNIQQSHITIQSCIKSDKNSLSLPRLKQPPKLHALPDNQSVIHSPQIGNNMTPFGKTSSVESHELGMSRVNKKMKKERQQFLNSIMNECQDDPYLKRYTDKENVGKYRCIANRIDERIQKIQQKY